MFYRVALHTFIFKDTTTDFTISFMNSPIKLLSRIDKEVAINLMLSMNFILYYIISAVLFPSLSIFTFFFIRTDKYYFHYFSLFSPIHSNLPSKSFVNSLIMKWKTYFEPLWKTTGISLDTLNFKLQMLCATPIYFPV